MLLDSGTGGFLIVDDVGQVFLEACSFIDK